jgi:hypothetical protein
MGNRAGGVDHWRFSRFPTMSYQLELAVAQAVTGYSYDYDLVGNRDGGMGSHSAFPRQVAK